MTLGYFSAAMTIMPDRVEAVSVTPIIPIALISRTLFLSFLSNEVLLRSNESG